MHPHDKNCQWCGFGPLMIPVPDRPGYRTFNPHDCHKKPPLTPEEGAAVAFAIIGIFTAIGQFPGIEACPDCGKGSKAWITEPEYPHRRRCLPCFWNLRSTVEGTK